MNIFERSESYTSYGERKPSTLWIKDNAYPVLVLTLNREWCKDKPYFVTDKYNLKWVRLQHQVAGIGCNQVYFWAAILQPLNEQVINNMKAIANYWDSTNIGCFQTSLKDVNIYNTQLETLFGVDCQESYKNLQEGVYPIDCTPENLSKLTSTVLPNDLRELLIKDISRQLYYGFHFKLYILSENSD